MNMTSFFISGSFSRLTIIIIFYQLVQEQEQEQEVEMEVQKEEVRVEAAPIRQDYSREDENPKPFPLESLGKGIASGEQGFFPCSEFCIKTWMGSSSVLPFPSFMHFSRNYYNTAWSLRLMRRLKNTAILLEWFPESNLKLSQEKIVLSESAKKELSEAFKLFDIDHSGCLSRR